MKQPLANFVKSLFSSIGIFVAQQFRGRVTGHELTRDLRILIRHDKPVCFDIGANLGQTIHQLQRCFPRPVIHSFEPASATYAALAKQSFGASVQVHQLAFGAEAGVAEFRNYEHSELNSFLPMNPDKAENFFADVDVVSTESVQVDTLDNFCRTKGIEKIDLLKIDTQGFELPILRGAAGLFDAQKIGAVLLELNFSTLYEGQSDALEILQFLRTRHLRLVDFYEKERVTGKELSWTTALFARIA